MNIYEYQRPVGRIDDIPIGLLAREEKDPIIGQGVMKFSPWSHGFTRKNPRKVLCRFDSLD
jgi:hypothetical protein